MTTIVYRDGVLAGDGRETNQNDKEESWIIIRDNCVKVHKLPDGSLFGGAHNSEDIERLLSALQKRQAPPKLDCIAGLRIDPRRRMWLYEGNIWQRLSGFKFYAVGSGSIYAWAALKADASAIEAVKIAISCDPFSGGKITSVRL